MYLLSFFKGRKFGKILKIQIPIKNAKILEPVNNQCDLSFLLQGVLVIDIYTVKYTPIIHPNLHKLPEVKKSYLADGVI